MSERLYHSPLDIVKTAYRSGDYASVITTSENAPTPALQLYRGRAQQALGRLVDARDSYAKAVTGYEQTPPLDPQDLISSRKKLLEAQVVLGNYESAKAQYQKLAAAGDPQIRSFEKQDYQQVKEAAKKAFEKGDLETAERLSRFILAKKGATDTRAELILAETLLAGKDRSIADVVASYRITRRLVMEIPQTHKSQQSQAYTLLGKVVEAAASHPQGKQIREEDARHIHLEPEAVAALYQKALVKDPQNEYAQDRYKALVGKDFVKKLKEPIAKYAPARHLPISPRLSKDAHARLDEGREVQWYWDKQSGKHKALIESLDRQIGEGMSPNTRIAVCIPTYMEEKNIYRTLEQYTKQENIDPKQVEIILLENHPAGKQRDNTRAEVVRFRHDYPDMTVRRVYHQFDQMVPFGYIKKIVFDLGLRRSMKRPADPKRPDLIMAGHDADSYGYKKNSFRYLLDIFDTNQDMDLLAGRADAPVEAMAKFPVLHAIVRFERYYKTISDRYNGKMRTSASGGCTYFRLSSYAAMGGYDDTLWRGSDSEHGKRMWYLRGEDPRRHMSYTDGLRFHTDPRRALEKMINGKHYADQWEDIQWQGVRQVIGTSWEDFSHPDLMTFDKARLEEEINAYKFVQKLAVNLQADPANSEVQKKKMILDRIMNSLGASYHMDGNRLVLDNTADLESGLQIYAEKFANQTA